MTILRTQVFIPAIAFLTTLVLLASFLKFGLLNSIRDIPNQRSLHNRPVPRIGGIALVIGTIGPYTLLDRHPVWNIVVPLLLLIGISIADDIWNLRAKWRFVVHFIAALMFAYSLLGFFPVDIITILVVFAIVWMTNLYNFMDGADGLAGGMTVIGFSIYGIAAIQTNQSDIAVISFCVASSAGAFLKYNFHPAKVFLGDVGSIPLGFAAGSIGFLGWNREIWPLWFPMLVFSPFIVDATLTLLKRCFRRERLWEAHREHYYQRTVRMGWGHRNTAFAEYALMICVGSSALAALHWTQTMQYALFIVWLAIFLSLVRTIDRAWNRVRVV